MFNGPIGVCLGGVLNFKRQLATTRDTVELIESQSNDDENEANEKKRSSALSIVRSGVERILGFPSKSAYFAFWKKLFLFDLVSNVARVGGTLFLYVFAPNLYQLLPPSIVG